MKIILIGAGELGKLVARKLCALHHDVVMIDLHASELEKESGSLDAMMLEGTGTDVEMLMRAGAAHADCMLALSGDEAANALSCILAKKLGTKRTICRVRSSRLFSVADSITPASLCIDCAFSPTEECVELIQGILPSRILQENIDFHNPDARINVINIPVNSVLLGKPIRELPFKEELEHVRLAAIIRKRELIVPHGDTMLQPGDRVYVAGRRADVDAFAAWLSRDAQSQVQHVVVAGCSVVSEPLVHHLLASGVDVRVIEGDTAKAERLLASCPPKLMVLHGDITDGDLLEEADVANCDVFAALSDRDEHNVLACLLASRMGAKKVIALTGKAEYMDILPDIERAGCWFNMTQIAANTAFRLMSKDTVRVDPHLQAIRAHMVELQLTKKSRYVGRPVRECTFPEDFLIALLLRGDEVIVPCGDTVLATGDVMIAIANTRTIVKLRRNL